MVSQHLDVVARHTQAVVEAGLRPEGRTGDCGARTSIWGSGICTAKEMLPLLFTENETNNERLFGTPNASRYVKDGINNYVVNGNHNSVNPEKTGTKSAAHYQLNVGAGKTATIRLRLSDLAPAAIGDPFKSFD